MLYLEAEPLMEIEACIGASLPMGMTLQGHTSIIPIEGGVFRGKHIRGSIIPGGADWNTTIDDDLVHFMARYSLLTDDGHHITITNEGLTRADFKTSFIKTRATFLAPRNAPCRFLLTGIHVGAVDVSRVADKVVLIRLFTLK